LHQLLVLVQGGTPLSGERQQGHLETVTGFVPRFQGQQPLPGH
jgi:hypothetical protein